MAARIHWAAAIAVAGLTAMAEGCRTAPERTPSAGAGAERTEGQGRATEEGRASAPEAGRASMPSESEAGAPAPGASPFEVTGRVERVDDSRIAIGGKTLAIDSSTSVTKGGVGASIKDIKEGDEVRATLSGSGDVPKAVRIEVMSPRR